MLARLASGLSAHRVWLLGSAWLNIVIYGVILWKERGTDVVTAKCARLRLLVAVLANCYPNQPSSSQALSVTPLNY